MQLANLPTPVTEIAVQLDSGSRRLSIKLDNLTDRKSVV